MLIAMCYFKTAVSFSKQLFFFYFKMLQGSHKLRLCNDIIIFVISIISKKYLYTLFTISFNLAISRSAYVYINRWRKETYLCVRHNLTKQRSNIVYLLYIEINKKGTIYST